MPASHRFLPIALLISAAYFMENLDGTVIVTALPQIARSFDVDPFDLSPTLTAYFATVAIVIPASGWVADRLGPRTVFAAAIVIFTGASLLCGLSEGPWSFTVCRVLQGLGGGMMMPVGRLILLRVTDKRDLVRAIAYVVWPGLAAPVLGPPVGGYIASYLDWRWIFFLNIPIGLVGAALAWVLVPDERRPIDRVFDVRGALFCAGATVCLVCGAQLLGWTPSPTGAIGLLLSAGVLLGVLTIRHLRRAVSPLIDLTPLRIRSFSVAMRGGALFRVTISAVPFLLPLMFQLAFGMDAFTSGLLLLAVFAGSLGMKTVSTWTLRHFGFRQVLLVNGVLVAVTVLACAAFTSSTPFAAIAAVLIVGGLTRSLQFSAYNSLTFAEVPEGQVGDANTLANVLQQLTIGLGVTAGTVSLRVASLLHPGAATGPSAADFRVAFVLLALATGLSTLDTLTLSRDAGALVSGHRMPAE